MNVVRLGLLGIIFEGKTRCFLYVVRLGLLGTNFEDILEVIGSAI